MNHKTTYKTALFWEHSEKGIKCLLCPHACLLTEGKTGICRTRINVENTLKTQAYGNLCSLSIDPIEKKPLFHFLPSTQTLSLAIEGCTFRCLNCQNFGISQQSPTGFSTKHYLPDEILNLALDKKCSSISYTYSEPVVFYEYMLDVAKLAKKNRINNVMVTNGFINPLPLAELCKYMDAVNVDVKSFNENIYKKLTGGSLEPVKKTLQILQQEGIWTEITCLIIPGWTDNADDIKNMSEWLVMNNLSEIPIHFSRFYPTYKLADVEPTPNETLVKAREIALSAGMKYVYFGNIRSNGGEDTFCHTCKKKLISRLGFEVIENKVINKKCLFCGQLIPGKWDFENLKEM